MKKILGFALIFSLVIPIPATARAIRLKEKTNDGATLSVFTTAEPASQSGWTVFKYEIEKDGSSRENIGVTPYCSHGKISRNESVATLELPIPGWAKAEDIRQIREISSMSDLSHFITEPGWIVDLGGKVTAIQANSPGSRSLLSAVCGIIP
ncbi:MAG TPA: hypothetical protein V6D11_28330 [Waterburya sp.]|jgi:hypothetical protein